MARGQKCFRRGGELRFLRFKCGKTEELNDQYTEIRVKLMNRLHAKTCDVCGNNPGEILSIPMDNAGMTGSQVMQTITNKLADSGIAMSLECSHGPGRKNDPVTYRYNEALERWKNKLHFQSHPVPEAPALGFVMTEIDDEVIYVPQGIEDGKGGWIGNIHKSGN